MTIGFCYNVKKNLPSTDPLSQIDAEFDSPSTTIAIKKALESGGHQVIEIEADEDCFIKLHKLRTQLDIVFNIAEGTYGDTRESQVPMYCEVLQIPYTHSSSLTHAIKLDKSLTKKVLTYHGINTPLFQLFTNHAEPLTKNMSFPIILKPNAEGSSKGILNANLVHNEKRFRERLRWLFEAFDAHVLAEEFLSGREFTVALLGNPPEVLPIIEQRLDQLPKDYPPFASYEVKWIWEDTLTDPKIAYDCPAKLDKPLESKVKKICLDTFAVLNCRDAARVDVRLDAKGNPSVLEINTLPGMMPAENGISYFPISANTAGYTYNAMVLAILEAAAKRYKLKL